MNQVVIDNPKRSRPVHARPADPQIVVTGRLKESPQGGEYIVFRLKLALFVIVAIVNIPADGETSAPVYVKFKVDRATPRPNGERGDDDSDDNED
jgi:hypothetical protein